MNLKAFVCCVCLMCLATVAGCGPSGPKLYKFKGKVTHNGKPVKYLYITFTPDDENTKASAVGAADKEGNFELMIASTPGVFPGLHKISCHDPLIELGSKTSTEPEYLACIQKYSQKNSTLTIDIDKNHSNYELKLD